MPRDHAFVPAVPSEPPPSVPRESPPAVPSEPPRSSLRGAGARLESPPRSWRGAAARLLAGCVAAASFLVPATGVSAQEARALEVLEAAEARYESFSSLCADFRQVLEVPLLDQETESRGRICQKQPDRFLMRFEEPEGDVVVADGEWLWIYYPSMDPGQVIRSPLAASGGRFDFHREFLADPGEKYAASWTGRESVDGRETDVIRLVPRDDSAYRSARVWIDRRSRMLLRLEIEHENGSVRRVRLSGQQVNPSLADSLFRFSPPSGAQVITRPAG